MESTFNITSFQLQYSYIKQNKHLTVRFKNYHSFYSLRLLPVNENHCICYFIHLFFNGEAWNTNSNNNTLIEFFYEKIPDGVRSILVINKNCIAKVLVKFKRVWSMEASQIQIFTKKLLKVFHC